MHKRKKGGLVDVKSNKPTNIMKGRKTSVFHVSNRARKKAIELRPRLKKLISMCVCYVCEKRASIQRIKALERKVCD